MPYPYEITNKNCLNTLEVYIKTIKHAQKKFEKEIIPIFDSYLQNFEVYMESISKRRLDINYHNPLIYTQKQEYVLYMLLIEYSNQLMKTEFEATPNKIVLLPRCLTGPKFNLLKVQKTKVGWHRIIGCNTESCPGWELSKLGERHNFKVFITMGSRFKEPNFLRVFKNLRKEYNEFGLIAVACLPELALGRTYIMEMGIPSQAVPLLFSGCEKWHGLAQVVPTKFSLDHILHLLNLNNKSSKNW